MKYILKIAAVLASTVTVVSYIVVPRPPSDGINRVQDKPSHDDSGEPLFHIQESPLMPQVPNLVPGGRLDQDQEVIDVPGIPEGPDNRGPVLLRTQLAVTPDITIFASYIRDVQSLEQRFNDENKYSIVLAPSDRAVKSLGKKPWAFPTPVDEKLPDERKDEIIRNNIRTFIAGHVHFGNLDAVFTEGETIVAQRIKMESGNTVILNKFGDTITVQNEQGEYLANITSATRVKNGVIFVLDKSLAFP